MADQVWISEEDAIQIIKNSAWGKLIGPNVVETHNLFDFAGLGPKNRVVHGLSDTKKAILKFDMYIRKTLESFAKSNKMAFRIVDDNNQFDEIILQKFIQIALDNKIEDEFGPAPTISVN